MVEGPAKPRFSRLGVAVVIVLVVAAVVGVAVWRVIRGDLPSEAEKGRADREPRGDGPCPLSRTCRSSTSWTCTGAPTSPTRAAISSTGTPRTAVAPRAARSSSTTISRADFQLIKDALAASGTPIERVGGRFLSDGRVRWAWFMSHHGALRDVVVAGVRP